MEKKPIDKKLEHVEEDVQSLIDKLQPGDVRDALTSIHSDLSELKKDIRWVMLLRHIYKKKLFNGDNID